MTQDEIIEMAIKAGMAEEIAAFNIPIIETFAKLVADKAIAELESQEPRNVRERWNVELDGNDLLVCFNDHEKGDKCQYERYSPQRSESSGKPSAWVGLTDYEIGVCSTEAAMNRSEMVGGAVTFARAIEAKLKQKNGFVEEKNT
jgi:hypothetical protein